MPALALEKDVFTFEELSDKAKETAREWMRELEMTDFDPEFVLESFHTAAGILGITFDTNRHGENRIHWRGFCSRGDGASFEGYYSHVPQSSVKIREEYPEDTALHAIADGLHALQVGHRLLTGHWLDGRIEQSGNYVHEMTMSATVTDSETGQELDDCEADKRITELMRDLARWLYKNLEEEYDHRTSDEFIDETIMAHEYEFDEAGEVFS